MKRLILFLCLALSMTAYAQTGYEKEWKEVTKMQENAQPRSVSQLCEKIYRQAEKDKNFPQQLRAFVTRMGARSEIDRDSFYTDYAALQAWKLQSTDSLQRSVLAQVLADRLVNYVIYNVYAMRQRAETDEEDSENLRKWTYAQVRNRFIELYQEALSCPRLLSLTPTKEYSGLMQMGDASRYFLHDMLHMAGIHSVELMQDLQIRGVFTPEEGYTRSREIYKNLLEFYKKQGNRGGVLLLTLRQLEEQKNRQEMTDSIYRIHLNELIQTNQDLDVCVEAYLQLVISLKNEGKNTEALTLIDKALERYSRYDRANALKQERANILAPELSVSLPQTAYPGQRMRVQASQHNNLDGFTLRFHPLSIDANHKKLNDYNEKNFLKEFGKTPFDASFQLIRPADYNTQDTTFYYDAPAKGIYLVEVSTKVKGSTPQVQLLYISELKTLIRRQVEKGETDLVVVDRKSGAPVSGAKLLVYSNKGPESTLLETLTTDKNGRYSLQRRGDALHIFTQHGNDKFEPGTYIYNNSRNFQSGDESPERIQLLTDRGLYRPGQAVYVKGIAYNQQGDNTEVIPSKSYTLTLLDANNKEVGQATLQSNEFGSFSHTFTLPARTLGGSFQIRCGDYSAWIQVEEYKRPTFEVLMDTVKTAPQLGDSVTLTGRALTLSGFPLQNDSVSYTVTQEQRFFWRYFGARSKTIVSGSTRTDAQGRFSVTYRLGEPTANNKDEISYRFRLTAEVTDATGETQRGEATLNAGNRSIVLTCELPQEICRDSVFRITPRVENLNGIPVNAEVFATLTNNNDRVLGTQTLRANEVFTVDQMDQMPSGEYKVILHTFDANNRRCEWKQEITLFSIRDTRPPVQKPMWSKQMHTTFPQQGNAELLFGTSEKNVYLMYDLLTTGKLQESKLINLSDTLLRISLPYKEEYGEGVLLNLCFVKDGKVYQEIFSIQKPLPQKQLKLKWTVFRDRLQPGQKEEWSLSIKNPDGTTSQAELMAAMYDASLDQILPYRPSFEVGYSRRTPYASWNEGNRDAYYWINFVGTSYKYPEFAYDRWNLRSIGRSPIPMRANGVQRISTKEFEGLAVADIDNALQGNIAGLAVNTKTMMAKASVADIATDEKVEVMEEAMVITTDEEVMLSANASVRENFNETAFFYPQLRTDENGEVRIAFTLPESLTRWRFTGIAHTKDVKTGMLQADITASKPFMLSAHLPRYLRQGDVTELSASIRNYTGTPVKGQVKCELFDPYTNKVFKKFQKNFSVQSDSTLAIFFELESLKGYEMVGIRMTADGDNFSDGEQHLLALLPDKTHLIESIPLTLRGKGSKEYSLAPLFNNHSTTATDRKITVELTANPAWLAVQALPYLNTPTGEDAITYATTYYANSLSAWIVALNPELKSALEQWKASGNATQSNLTRNSELQELLLEETPWVAQAEDEAARRARLITLTDGNTLNYQQAEALKKLKELQLYDGSFPWFKGMMSSLSTTEYVLETLGRLTVLADTPEDALSQSIRKDAYAYLHKERVRAYNSLIDKHTPKCSSWDLRYLYLCTLTKEEVPATARKAYNFYLDGLRPSLADLSVPQRATAVLVLLHAGRKTDAEAFYRSLKEYAVGNEEMGLFFANEGLNDPTATLTRALEAAQAMNDTAFADELKINLLRQKQTQMWHSNVSTANAIYGLLKGSSTLLKGEGECTVTLDKQVIRSQPKAGDADALMGYTKISFTGNREVQASKITLSHTGTGICWGAVYGESMEQLDRVQEQGVQVKVEKELFVRRQGGNAVTAGVQWEKITPKTTLRKGDRIMSRLTVTTDRALEFVTLKDQRAACLEPIRQISGYNLGGYFKQEKDASSQLFFDRLQKGTHLIEIESYVTRSGEYNSGIATLQSAYATEFSGHSASQKLTVQ